MTYLVFQRDEINQRSFLKKAIACGPKLRFLSDLGAHTYEIKMIGIFPNANKFIAYSS